MTRTNGARAWMSRMLEIIHKYAKAAVERTDSDKGYT
jgi:hypothetical protein